MCQWMPNNDNEQQQTKKKKETKTYKTNENKGRGGGGLSSDVAGSVVDSLVFSLFLNLVFGISHE